MKRPAGAVPAPSGAVPRRPAEFKIMNFSFLLAETNGDGAVQEIARTFGVDWSHLVAQIISFGIVCLLLYRFAYRRVLQTLAARRNEIAGGLANAEKIKDELGRTEANRQEVMKQADERAAKLIEEARAAAAKVQDLETKKALTTVEHILAKAREAAAQDHARMLAELKREVAHIVVHTTRTVTGKILTQEDQRRITEETAKAVRD
jgi:F-type H+-transporting ATPase subunit b